MDLEDVQQRLTRAMGLNAQAMLWAQSPRNERVYQLCRHAAVELQELMWLVTAASDQQASTVEPTNPPR